MKARRGQALLTADENHDELPRYYRRMNCQGNIIDIIHVPCIISMVICSLDRRIACAHAEVVSRVIASHRKSLRAGSVHSNVFRLLCQ